MNTAVLFYLDGGLDDSSLFFNGENFIDPLEKKIASAVSGTVFYYSALSGYDGFLSKRKNFIPREGADDAAFWKKIQNIAGADCVARVNADSPFLDPEIFAEMHSLHLESLAEYTYSENLPSGLSADFLSGELIDELPETEEKTLPLREVVRSNINRFDIELYYKAPDIRDRRLSFRSGDKRSLRVMENMASIAGGIPSYASIASILASNPGVILCGPSYLEIEICGLCALECVFCHRRALSAEHGSMDAAIFAKALADMREIGLPYTVSLGGSGEPLRHPAFYEIASAACGEPLVERVIVETCGTDAGANYASFAGSASGAKISTIVNISGYSAATYAALHGADCFDKVLENISAIREKTEGLPEKLFVQLMKINETENFTDQYYDFWEKQKVAVIFQKQNTFLGLIPDRRYSDLSPLVRTACRHLERDVCITADGSFAFCRQDPDALLTGKNIKDTSIKEFYESMKINYLKNHSGDYPVKPNCASCDEWYTFNF